MEPVHQAISAAIDELNIGRDREDLIGKSAETPLFGESSLLDSLGLVTLIVGVETEIRERLGVEIVLADERALSARRSPFRTVGTLTEFIGGRLGELSDG